jgi:signal peptidase II
LAVGIEAEPESPGGDAAPVVAGPRRLSIVAGVALAVLIADQLTKWLVVRHYRDGHVDHLVWKLQFNLVHNSGTAFSKGQGLGPLFGVIALVVAFLLFRAGRSASRLSQAIAIGLVVGGALGNLVDRLFRASNGFLNGRVVDFIDFQFWPVFNVADIGVTLGVIVLVFELTRSPR